MGRVPIESRPAEAAERLAWEMGSWRSIEIKVRIDLLVNQVRKEGVIAATKLSHRYIETSGGKRLFETRTFLENGDEVPSAHYFDGHRAASLQRVRAGEKQFDSLQIRRSFSHEAGSAERACPKPLAVFYLGHRPLHEVLPTAEHLGDTRLLDRDCDVFLIQPPIPDKGGRAVCILDRATAIPLKILRYRDERARVADQPSSVWSALSLDRVQGHFLPLHSEDSTFSSRESDRVQVARRITVEEVHFDRDYPETVFWPRAGPETQVFDSLNQKHQLSKVLMDQAKAEAAPAPGPPLRADPDGDWPGAWPQVSIGLGLAVLLTAGVLWWRRR